MTAASNPLAQVPLSLLSPAHDEDVDPVMQEEF